MILQNVIIHPCAGEILIHRFRLDVFPAIGDCLKLVRNYRQDVILPPMRPDICLIGRILLPDKEEPYLTGHFSHPVRILFFNGFQCPSNSVSAAPGLKPYRSGVCIIKKDFYNML